MGTVETDTLNVLTGSLDQAAAEEKKYIVSNTGNDKVVAAPIMAHNFGALII